MQVALKYVPPSLSLTGDHEEVREDGRGRPGPGEAVRLGHGGHLRLPGVKERAQVLRRKGEMISHCVFVLLY